MAAFPAVGIAVAGGVAIIVLAPAIAAVVVGAEDAAGVLIVRDHGSPREAARIGMCYSWAREGMRM